MFAPFLCALVFVQAPPESPLKSLEGIAQILHGGIEKFMKGEDVPEAFKPWRASTLEEVAVLRQALKEAGASRVEPKRFELELEFWRKGKPVYLVRMYVWVTTSEARLGSVEGVEKEDFASRSQLLRTFKGAAEPLATSASALAEVFQSGKVERFPLVSEETLKRCYDHDKLTPKEILAADRKRAEEASAKIIQLKPDEVRVVVDDVEFIVFDQQSKPCGEVEGEFRTLEGEGLAFTLGRYLPYIRKE